METLSAPANFRTLHYKYQALASRQNVLTCSARTPVAGSTAPLKESDSYVPFESAGADSVLS